MGESITINCPNCGAPVRGCECEYCGSVFRSKPTAKKTPERDRISALVFNRDFEKPVRVYINEITVYSAKTGKLVGKWATKTDASEATGVAEAVIRKCCEGKRKQANGYCFSDTSGWEFQCDKPKPLGTTTTR